MELSESEEIELNVKEKRLLDIFSQFESTIMRLQSILVWENHHQSAMMLLGVNVLFWLLTSTSNRVIYLVAVAAITVMCFDAFCNRIWPEIRVVPKHPEDEEGWTPVHTRLLSVPELCHHLAEMWVAFNQYHASFWDLRSKNPAKFCAVVSCTSACLAMIGRCISGVMLSYIIIMSLLLWPCAEYHNFNKKIYSTLEPLWMQLEYSMKNNHINESHKRKRQRSDRSRASDSPDGVADDYSDSDSDLMEFCPPHNAATVAALARAVADPDSELSEGERMSRSPVAHDYIDDETYADSEPSFAVGLPSFPAFDDGTFDHSSDELDKDIFGPQLSEVSRKPHDEHVMPSVESRFQSDNRNDDSTYQAFPSDSGNRTASMFPTSRSISDTVASVMTNTLTALASVQVASNLNANILKVQYDTQRPREPEIARPHLGLDADLGEFEVLDTSDLANTGYRQDDMEKGQRENFIGGFFSKLLGKK